MATSYSSSVTASQVGSQFVEQYYDVLKRQPEFTHRFYTGSSTMIRVDGDSTLTASTFSQIHTLVRSLQFSGIEIKTINSVESLSEGLMVVVSGSVLSDCFNGWREFVQSFFLVTNENKTDFLVMIDVFHFVTQKDLSGIVFAKDPVDIHYIKREDSETVEDFLFRFTKETSLIPRADDKMKISGFIHGVRNDELVEKLFENIPQTVENMIHRVKGFVRGKKARGLNTLSVSPYTRMKWDPNQYCEFHEVVGHDTDDCISLKKLAEEALQTGNLSHFVEEVRKHKSDPFVANKESDDDEYPKRKKIRMIYCIDTPKVSGVEREAEVLESC